MSLLRHEDDKIGVVVRVVEVLHDGLCVLGRTSRMLLVEYPTSKRKEPESCILGPGPTVRTRKRSETKTQTKQEDRILFHY